MKKIFLLLSVALIFSSLSACSTKRPEVCVTAYPIEFLVKRIGGDRAQICNLTNGSVIQRSQPVEDYQEKVKNAQLILTMGQLEPYWEIIRSDVRASEAQLIDLVSSSAVYKFKRFSKIEAGNNLVFIESPYYEAMAFERIDTYEMDPVLWIDPIAMTSMARIIRDWFVSYYPEDQRFFNDNFKQLESELVRLDSEFQLVKNKNLSMQFVSMTPSFGNWQKAYGVEVYPIILSRYGVLPTSIQMELIMERIRRDGIQYIAFEPNLTPELREIYEYIKTELELTQVNLHNLTFLSEEEIAGGKDYFDIMYENLTFLESLAGDSLQPSEPTDTDSE